MLQEHMSIAAIEKDFVKSNQKNVLKILSETNKKKTVTNLKIYSNPVCSILLKKSSTCCDFNPLSTNFAKWSNTLKQFSDELFECV